MTKVTMARAVRGVGDVARWDVEVAAVLVVADEGGDVLVEGLVSEGPVP
jgi:hypothetical protein